MFPHSVENLTKQLSKWPEIGPRAAARLVFFLLNQNQNELDSLALLIKNIRKNIQLCPQCFNIAEGGSQLCLFCKNGSRDKQMICVVEKPTNIPPIEKTKQYGGLYHVLGGLISPVNGILPDNLRIRELVRRVQADKPGEIILALSPTVEGDTTTFYIEKLLKPLKIKTSRLARGVSSGSDLQYADEHTLTSALLGRK